MNSNGSNNSNNSNNHGGPAASGQQGNESDQIVVDGRILSPLERTLLLAQAESARTGDCSGEEEFVSSMSGFMHRVGRRFGMTGHRNPTLQATDHSGMRETATHEANVLEQDVEAVTEPNASFQASNVLPSEVGQVTQDVMSAMRIRDEDGPVSLLIEHSDRVVTIRVMRDGSQPPRPQLPQNQNQNQSGHGSIPRGQRHGGRGRGGHGGQRGGGVHKNKANKTLK